MYNLMYNLIYDKFIRNKELCQKLKDTGSKYLEETNHWEDEYYGVNYLTRQGENYNK